MCRHLRYCFSMLTSVRVCVSSFICICVTGSIFWLLWINRESETPWYYRSGDNTTSAVKNLISDTNKTFEHYNVSVEDGIKYILLWAHTDWVPFSGFIEKEVFIKNNCTFSNCYVTGNKSYFGTDNSRFHAVAFNGRLRDDLSGIPRWPHQKFIYVNTESSANTGIKHNKYDGLFNWTCTYRLDSDIPYPYMIIKNSSGNVVGPAVNMEWKENMTEIDQDLADKLRKKKKWKAAVVFMSHCDSKSGRDFLIYKLKKRLLAHGYNLDIYGKCGTLQCPRDSPECDRLVEDYYFYLVFENSFADDYVTEKLLRAVNHYAVPVVFGGADYSRFLPPNSYLDAKEHTPDNLAAAMVELIKHPDKYSQFFGWRKHYSYHNPMSRENICGLCDALNNKTKYQTHSVYPDMRRWWNH